MHRLIAKRIDLPAAPGTQEFRFELTNPTAEEILLDRFELFHADSPEALGLRAGGCRLFRSGRHKNDMPAVAAFGVMDDAMLDALGGMTEAGERSGDAPGQRVILSDHLTLLGHEDQCLLIGFMTGRDQLLRTEIAIDDAGRFLSLSCSVEFGCLLPAGASVLTEILRIEQTAQPEEAVRRFAQDKAARYGSRRSNPPSVFCTWYYYGLTVTQEDVLTNLEQIERRGLPFDVFQIDEGWEKTLGWWEANEKFPMPMDEIAARIRKAGLTPGIWTSPFVAKETAPVWKEHPDWILRDRSGAPCIFPMNDTTYWVFDITVPETRPYFTELYRRLTFDWGYAYHKLDFTRAAIIYEDADYRDKHITPARAYYEAVAAIRRGMGEEAYFLMCGGLYDPIIGLVDAQRSGSDVLSMWSSTINKGGKTAPYTIKQSLLRWYMNAWWHNDPDALMIRRSETMERGLRLTYGLLTDDEVRTVAANQLTGGGIVCSTEPLARIDEDRLLELRRILPPMDRTVQPLDLMNSGRFPDRVRVTYPQDGRVLIVLINWSDTDARAAQITLDENTLGFAPEAGARYAVCDYYAGQYIANAEAGRTYALAPIPPHSTSVVKIERIAGQPVVVASDGHYSMGLELEQLSEQDGMLRAAHDNRFACPVRMKVLLPQSGRVVHLELPAMTRTALCIPAQA